MVKQMKEKIPNKLLKRINNHDATKTFEPCSKCGAYCTGSRLYRSDNTGLSWHFEIGRSRVAVSDNCLDAQREITELKMKMWLPE